MVPSGGTFAGPLTYKNADPLRAIAAWAPADRILIETDAPSLPPVSPRGKRNEPAYVPLVAAALAQARALTPDEAGRLTTANARRICWRNASSCAARGDQAR